MQTEEKVRRHYQGMDRPGVRKVPEGSKEQGKMEKTGCKIICGAPTTLAVKRLMMMMMTTMMMKGHTNRPQNINMITLEYCVAGEEKGLNLSERGKKHLHSPGCADVRILAQLQELYGRTRAESKQFILSRNKLDTSTLEQTFHPCNE